MTQAAIMPAGWAKILDDIRRHVDDAVAAAETRMATMPVVEVVASVGHQQSFVEIGQHLQGLGERLRSAQNVIEATDQVLQAEEARLQQLQAANRRLADWAARRGAR